MPINRLDHYSIRTADIEKTRRFYVEVVGLIDGPRPPFNFPGAWLYSGEQPVVHVIGIDPKDKSGLVEYMGDRYDETLSGTGTIDHVAFAADDLAEMLSRLKKHGVVYRERTVPDLNLHQVFLDDPNGVLIEINYMGAKTAEARR